MTFFIANYIFKFSIYPIFKLIVLSLGDNIQTNFFNNSAGAQAMKVEKI